MRHLIIGSGPAGAALAVSLLEHCNDATHVTVLEAGDAPPPNTRTAAGFPGVLREGCYRQLKHAGCSLGKVAAAGEGTVLGGGSTVNAGYYVVEPHYWSSDRGWLAQVHGDERAVMESVWNPAQMQQCAETVRARLGISTTQPQLRCAISTAFLKACQKQGFSVEEGNLAATRAHTDAGAGAGYCGLNVNTMADGDRRGAALLLPTHDPRLSVRIKAAAVRVLLRHAPNDPPTHPPTAYGVELADGEVVLADRVYVCAGPEASTRLLLHSGVGDRSAAHWDACSIPCTVHNAGVGKGYHDHPTLVDGFFSWRAYSARKSKLPPYKASLFTEESQVSLVTHGGYGFMHELDSFIKHKPLLRLLRLVHFLTPWWRHNREPFVFGGLFVTASFPDHRAQLQLHTADPLAPLHVDAAELTPAELDVLLRGLELASTLEADMRKHLSSKRGRWGCETIHRLLQWIGLRAPRTTKSHTLRTRRKQFIRKHLATLWHPAGGCCVGAALDATLRVRGTRHLRVCGAAAFPCLPQANPQAQCYAMGFRLGQLVGLESAR